MIVWVSGVCNKAECTRYGVQQMMAAVAASSDARASSCTRVDGGIEPSRDQWDVYTTVFRTKLEDSFEDGGCDQTNARSPPRERDEAA